MSMPTNPRSQVTQLKASPMKKSITLKTHEVNNNMRPSAATSRTKKTAKDAYFTSTISPNASGSYNKTKPVTPTASAKRNSIGSKNKVPSPSAWKRVTNKVSSLRSPMANSNGSRGTPTRPY